MNVDAILRDASHALAVEQPSAALNFADCSRSPPSWPHVQARERRRYIRGCPRRASARRHEDTPLVPRAHSTT